MTATFAKKIAVAESGDKQFIDTVFIAGMMHDVGKLLLFSAMHDAYVQAVNMARKQGIPSIRLNIMSCIRTIAMWAAT